MNQFIINGSVAQAPLTGENDFRALVDHIHTQYVSDQSLISSFKVNGVEITADEENALSSLPISELESVEVTLVHPKELTEDTLQTLLVFAEQLAVLSRDIGAKLAQGLELDSDFTRLIDGLETVVDSITTVRALQDLTPTHAIAELERDLLNILRSLSNACDAENEEYRVRLLSDELPRNLEAWKTRGIPQMIRSRDS